MTLLTILLHAAQHLPRVRKHLNENSTMTTCQQIIAAALDITNKERFGFFCAETPALVEKFIDVLELPDGYDSYMEVKARLFTPTMAAALLKIGVELYQNNPRYFTLFGPGVRKS